MREVTDSLIWREPVPADAPALGLMTHQAWVDTYGPFVRPGWFDTWTVQDSAATWRETLTCPDGARRMAVFALDGSVAAWVAAGPPRINDDIDPAVPDGVAPVRDLELWSLYVARDLHGSGLGADLLRWAVGDAPAELWTFERNARAERFYTWHGFQRDGATLDNARTGMVVVRMVR